MNDSEHLATSAPIVETIRTVQNVCLADVQDALGIHFERGWLRSSSKMRLK